ncbi:MAG: class I SAM-dependent methyltransferase [Acidobacteriota bacterium]
MSPTSPPESEADTIAPTSDRDAPINAADRRRLDEEIERYRDCTNVHELPAIFHLWSHRYVLPKLQACGFESIAEFQLHYLDDACRAGAAAGDPEPLIASIGSGNCDVEVELAEALRARGLDQFRFHCLDLNPHMLERGRALAADRNLEQHFLFEEVDLDRWTPSRRYAGALAHHSLHHLVGLEHLFASLREALGDHGVFVINDMIGRNGHMRWPEALHHVGSIWSERLEPRHRYNNASRCMSGDFVNFDCSQEGNEGIRAQDILPLLLEEFHFDLFIGFANIIEPFVDRIYGHNFDAENPQDVDLILEIAELDERLLSTGEITPTQMFAAVRTRPVASPRHYAHWTADFCVRWPDSPYRRSGSPHHAAPTA